MSPHRSQPWNGQPLAADVIATDTVVAQPQPDRLHNRELEFSSPKSERLFTFRALDSARRHALTLPRTLLTRGRTIIFSDLHLGDKAPRSDDFRHNERTYCHALEHYLGQDYRLILNGDVEEGWKTPFDAIAQAYESTVYRLEREFVRRGPDHYFRVYGNHDDAWADPRQVARHLGPVLGQPIHVYPALIFGDRIMITHGHQGDLNSDRRAWFSRRVIRHIWRPLQHALKLSVLSASQLYTYRQTREQCLYEWANQHRHLLIAGHTHRPMFHSRGVNGLHGGWLRSLTGEAGASALDGTASGDQHDPPNYLNAGCCVHTDGITGLEIEHGEMRLVQWAPDVTVTGAGRIQRTVLRSGDLGALLVQI